MKNIFFIKITLVMILILGCSSHWKIRCAERPPEHFWTRVKPEPKALQPLQAQRPKLGRKRLAQPATPPDKPRSGIPENHLLKQVSDPTIASQIREISHIKEWQALSNEQKRFAASLGDEAINSITKMNPKDLSAIPAEDRLNILHVVNARANMINAASVSAERDAGAIRDYEKKNPQEDLTAMKTKNTEDLQEKFNLSSETASPEALATHTRNANTTLMQLGTEANLRLEALTQTKKQLESLSGNENLSESEKQKLKETTNKYLSHYLDLTQDITLSQDISSEEKTRIDEEFGKFVEQKPEEAKAFLATKKNEQQSLFEEINRIEEQNKEVSKDPNIQKSIVLTKKIDAIQYILDNKKLSSTELNKKLEEKRILVLKNTALMDTIKNKNVENDKKLRILKIKQAELEKQINALQNPLHALAEKSEKKALEVFKESIKQEKHIEEQLSELETKLKAAKKAAEKAAEMWKKETNPSKKATLQEEVYQAKKIETQITDRVKIFSKELAARKEHLNELKNTSTKDTAADLFDYNQMVETYVSDREEELKIANETHDANLIEAATKSLKKTLAERQRLEDKYGTVKYTTPSGESHIRLKTLDEAIKDAKQKLK